MLVIALRSLRTWSWKALPRLRQRGKRAQAALLGEERLEGDNQYVCAFCEAKVDATRQLRLRSVPPYLCLSLQRFVFDLKARSHLPLLPLHCPP